MAMVRNYHKSGVAPMAIVTRHTEEDSYLCGRVLHIKAGWHWWWEATSPNGEALSSTTKGPFSTEDDALADAAQHGLWAL